MNHQHTNNNKQRQYSSNGGDLNLPEYLTRVTSPSSSDNGYESSYQQQQQSEYDNNISSLSNQASTSYQNTNMSLNEVYRIPGLNYSNLSFKPQGYSSNETNQINDISTLFKSTSSKGVFKIVGRVRPLNKSSYIVSDTNRIMEIGEDHKTVLIGKYLNKANSSSTSFQFTFDRIFDEFANQSMFYSSCGYPLFKSFVGGVNANIITYGQVCSTYTLL